MIIFINGAFGIGKTTVAERLVKRLPHSLLFDPEEVGFFLRGLLAPIDEPDDFQDYVMWRSLVVTTVKLLRQTYNRPLVIPMTIAYLPYFEEVVGGIRSSEPDVYHFCLTAPIAIIYDRLGNRGEKPGDWTWVRAERCHEAFQSPAFNVRIPTETASPDAVVETILAALPRQKTP